MGKRLRHVTQIVFFIIIALIAVNHTLVENGNGLPFVSEASFHAICPFGGVEAFFAFLNYDVLIQKIQPSSFILLGLILFSAVLFGPVVCSYICPLGSIQEWVGKIGKRIFANRYNTFVPAKVDKPLRYLRYVTLAVTVYLTTNTLKLVFLEVDPYYALFHFWSSGVAVGSLIVLGLTLVGSLFIERPWCKYACPFGALLGLSNFFRIFGIRREPSTCISCNKCTAACPMNIDVATAGTVRDHQCISCNECTSEAACPVDKTVRSKVKTSYVPVILAAVFVVGIAGSNLIGIWAAEEERTPVKIAQGEFEGLPDPEDIRGSYSFGDLEEAFDVPAEVTAEAFGIRVDDPSIIKAKDLELFYPDLGDDVEIGTGAIKTFISLYTGIPYVGEDGLPQNAVAVLEREGKWSDELAAEYDGRIVVLPESEEVTMTVPDKPEDGTDEEHEETVIGEIKGKTTVAELIEWGMTLEEVEEVIGVEVPNVNMTVRDICNNNGISFGEKKLVLAGYVE